ncbi:hypothetical protein J7E97_32915 [Streptomyces sp. ISL-66]|uniref:hypothetical protein n=1 Tax=Streptomyces sp. ISL-66 TaxID=2819186 RepID=UPI001BE98E8D|nr:hypothetical protein [Streptomyces sp. ISL-66]MBT2472526.1 hypothetical protein [Streptomyces sp. ISL-66]
MPKRLVLLLTAVATAVLLGFQPASPAYADEIDCGHIVLQSTGTSVTGTEFEAGGDGRMEPCDTSWGG